MSVKGPPDDNIGPWDIVQLASVTGSTSLQMSDVDPQEKNGNATHNRYQSMTSDPVVDKETVSTKSISSLAHDTFANNYRL